MTLEVGTVLGAYRIVAPIGAGGMGEVFLAQDSRLERNVALKILPRAFAGDAERLGRFVREAKSASALNHPNILTIHEIGVSEGFHYLATELIVGETLRERIARGALPVADGLEIALQVAAALGAAHAAGIVHRDVKPENVMIRADGLVKVLDFGLAKWSEPQAVDPQGVTLDRGRTHPGVVLGTVAYMSPEQSRGKTVDARTDLWSLGVVLYEMLSGRQPFEGESSTDVLANILHRDPPQLALEAEELAPEIDAILGRALAKERLERYATTRELMADLKARRSACSSRPSSVGRRRPGERGIWRRRRPRRRRSSAATGATARSSSASPPARGSTGSAAALPRHAIAVLPFRNLSAAAENDYFCDGLAEELLNALAKIDGLKVAARTSAFAFKDKSAGVSEIGRALGVTTVLEGSVRTSGNRMRITVQLVNAADGYHLWSERYDRAMQDIFDVQDEITLAIVDALKIRLFGDERAAALKRGTENAAALRALSARPLIAGTGALPIPSARRSSTTSEAIARGSRLRARLCRPRRVLRPLPLALRRAAARQHAEGAGRGAAGAGDRRHRGGGARRVRGLSLLLRLGSAGLGARAPPRHRAPAELGDRLSLARQHRTPGHGPMGRVACRRTSRGRARSACHSPSPRIRA